MFVFCITAVALTLCGIRLSIKYKENIESALAAATCVLILVLYVLAFFRGMKLIGFISLAYTVFAVYRLAATKSFKDAAVTLPVVCVTAAVIAIAGILINGTQVTWWDDINFWFSDAKQLYFLNGFPGKYGNVSPEFGDYPPATSIFKWLFLQINSEGYTEGLQFVGYFALNTLLLLPLFGKIRCSGVRALGKTLGFIAVLLAPGIFNGIIYYGTPADITMGLLYGLIIMTIHDGRERGDNFYYIKIALYAAVMLITKSTGIEWALFALVFYVLFAKKDRRAVYAMLFAGATYLSWLMFCFFERRVAKLTGAGLKMLAPGGYRAPQNAADKAMYYIKGFFAMPMHADRNFTLDISAGAAVAIIFIVLFALGRLGIAAYGEIKKLAVFMAATGILAYGIIFLAHISIFQTEEQYLDAYAMALSLARYGFPYLFGAFYLLSGILFDGMRNIKTDKMRKLSAAGFILLVLLTSDYSGVYRQLWGYRQTALTDSEYNYDMVGDDGRMLADTLFSDKSLWGKRVLVMRDGHTYHWVHNAYISKEASPVPLVYDGFLAEQEGSGDISRKIISSHASYIYVEDDELLSADIFALLMADGTAFSSRTVYRVNSDGSTVRLSIQ